MQTKPNNLAFKSHVTRTVQNSSECMCPSQKISKPKEKRYSSYTKYEYETARS